MATFTSSVYSYGSGGLYYIQLTITDPGTVGPETTSKYLTATGTLYIKGTLYDSSGTNSLSGTLGSTSPNYPISNSDGYNWKSYDVASKSASVATSYGGAVAVSMTFSLTQYDALPNKAISGTVYIPVRPPGSPAAPATPTVSAITPTGATVAWTTPDAYGSSLTHYDIEFSSGGATQTIRNAWATSGVFSGLLVRNSSYTVRVRAISDSSSPTGAWSATKTFATLATVPDAPSLSVGSLTAVSALASWTAPNNGGLAISSYNVHLDTTDAFPAPTPLTSTVLSKSITGLTRDTTYCARVQGVNSLGGGGWSNTFAFVTSQSAPTAPTSPIVTGSDSTTASLSWTAPSDNGGTAITSYTVEYSTSDTFSGTTLTKTGVAGTSTTVTGLLSNTPYYFRVIAINAIGSSGVSTTTNVTTDTGVPGVPTSLNATSVTAAGATLNWTAPAITGGLAITGYDINISPGSLITGVSAPYALTGLTYNTYYQVSVAAVNPNGRGAYTSLVSFTTPKRTPLTAAAPTMSATNANQTTVTAVVPANGGYVLTGYVYQLSTLSDLLIEVSAATNTITRIGLLPDTTYYVRTAGVNSLGQGDWSTSTSFTTDAGYSGVLGIDVTLSHEMHLAMTGRLPATIKPNISSVTMVVSSEVKLTVPNPMWSEVYVIAEGVAAESDAIVGLVGSSYIARNLFADVGLVGTVNNQAVLGIKIYTADATTPEVGVGDMFAVGLVGTVAEQPYGDRFVKPSLKGINVDSGDKLHGY